eukprot:3397151-Pleurochrysis_carterae.AAC.2
MSNQQTGLAMQCMFQIVGCNAPLRRGSRNGIGIGSRIVVLHKDRIAWRERSKQVPEKRPGVLRVKTGLFVWLRVAEACGAGESTGRAAVRRRARALDAATVCSRVGRIQNEIKTNQETKIRTGITKLGCRAIKCKFNVSSEGRYRKPGYVRRLVTGTRAKVYP